MPFVSSPTPTPRGSLIAVIAAAVLWLLNLAACGNGGKSHGDGGTSAEGSSQVSSQAEQANSDCPASPTKLRGSAQAGESCSTFADCHPTCCSCTTSSRRWLGAACVDGVCASAVSTCARTESSFLCGGTVLRDGSVLPDAGPLPPPHRDASLPGTPTCVEGTSSSCWGTGLKWTGSLCCVDGPVVCTDGTLSSCWGTGFHWTGARCCVNGAPECVAGTSSSCWGTGFHWTGSTCCVDGPATCVAGTSSSCWGTGFHWTGSTCCVDGIANCVTGTSSSCYGSGKYWTGKLCCVK